MGKNSSKRSKAGSIITTGMRCAHMGIVKDGLYVTGARPEYQESLRVGFKSIKMNFEIEIDENPAMTTDNIFDEANNM